MDPIVEFTLRLGAAGSTHRPGSASDAPIAS
jgi:hypothetical protein